MRGEGCVTNQTVLLVYFPLLVISAILLYAVMRRNKKYSLVRHSLAFYICLICWIIGEMLYYTLKNPFLLRYVYDLKLIFVAFNAVATFMAVAAFYRLRRSIPRFLPVVLCVIPAITSVLALTSPWHELLRQNYQLLSVAPLTRAIETHAIWFHVHAVYCQLLLLAIAVIVVIRYRNLPRAYRHGSVLLLPSLLIYFGGAVTEMLNLDNLPLDFTLICASVASVTFYMSTTANGKADYLNFKHQEIVNYLDESVFILDNIGRIVDTNLAAKKWLQTVKTTYAYIPFDDMLDKLKAEGRITRKPAEDGVGEYVYCIDTKYPLIYQMRREDILDDNGKATGGFVLLTDITRNRLFVERLREMAGVDPLTDLYNRYGYQELLRRIDREENLPLSVVLGDINGLKKINDSFGHEAGDKLLQHAARIIRECCPANGYAARVGGDEFVILLPSCDSEGAEHVMRHIHERLSLPTEEGYHAAIALGAATKTMTSENINILLSEADKTMYQSKEAKG
jgi:diguanylate cyclase (GGDEF)-like protein